MELKHVIVMAVAVVISLILFGFVGTIVGWLLIGFITAVAVVVHDILNFGPREMWEDLTPEFIAMLFVVTCSGLVGATAFAIELMEGVGCEC